MGGAVLVAIGPAPAAPDGLIAEELSPLQEGFAHPAAPPGPRCAPGRSGPGPAALHLIEMAWPADERRLDALWQPIVAALRPPDSCAGARVLALHRMAGQQRLMLLVQVQEAAALSTLTARPCLEGGAVTRVEALVPLAP